MLVTKNSVYLLFLGLDILRILLVHLIHHVSVKIFRYKLWVNEVAVAPALASALVVLAALSLSKISDRRVFNNNLLHVVKFAIERPEATLCLLFSGKLHVDIPHHVFSYIVRDNQVKDLPMLAKFSEYFFVELLKVSSCLQELVLWDLKPIGESDGRPVILVDVEK